MDGGLRDYLRVKLDSSEGIMRYSGLYSLVG
jgi:hypothetical protein